MKERHFLLSTTLGKSKSSTSNPVSMGTLFPWERDSLIEGISLGVHIFPLLLEMYF